MSTPSTAPSLSTRASSCGPSNVIGVNRTRSARKPIVCAFAMLLAMTCCWAIEPRIPDSAV